uniref:Uncharacterized protein n=1 Tax=Strongyloides stercoralis TaxID=6248 RepID=A0AAF5CTV7_STRER
MGIHLRGIRNCRSARAGSGAWDNHFWSEQGAVVLLEVDLKDGNSSSMKWRLIETVSEARRCCGSTETQSEHGGSSGTNWKLWSLLEFYLKHGNFSGANWAL